MRKPEVIVATKQKVDVGTAIGVSFVTTIAVIAAAALLDTFLLAFLVSVL